MSVERMLQPSVPYRKEPLLADGEVEMAVPTYQCRQRSPSRAWMVILIVGALIAMGVMFLGGFYAGKHHGDKDAPPSSSASTASASTYRLQMADGSYIDVPALQGTQSVDQFVQCRGLSVNGQMSCDVSNPLLTPKGTVLLTMYQNNGQTSLVVTGSGDNYGEAYMPLRVVRDTGAQPTRQVNVHAENFRGTMSKPAADDYHRELGNQRFREPSHASTSMQWNNLGSHATIFHFNETDWTSPVKVYFEHNYTNAQNRLPGTVLGGHNFSHFDMDQLPTKTRPLLISPSPSDAQPMADDINQPMESQTDLLTSYWQKYQLFLKDLLSLTQPSRTTRSLTDRDQHGDQTGVMYKLWDRNDPSKALSTIRVIHDRRHGGQNGTVTYDVTNHTAGCRAQFSTLYHEYLSNNDKLENALHHQTYLYHHMNSSGHRMSVWQAVTPLDRPDSSSARPLVGQIPTDLPCIGDELGQLQDRLKTILDDPNASSGHGRQLLWSCGFLDSLKGGYDCAKSGYGCYSGVKSTFSGGFHWSNLWGAGKSCYGAGNTCYSYFHKCA